MHLFFTGVGFYLGYLAHRYEERSEERTQLLLAKYRHAPRQWAEMVKQDQGTNYCCLENNMPKTRSVPLLVGSASPIQPCCT